MTYFGFLLRFLAIPIVLLLAMGWRDLMQGRHRAISMRGWPIWTAIGLHVAVALIYTTPWDNYLVSTRVWWYDPSLVTGLTIGWVPIEEYTFFLLQPILGGLWLLFLLRRPVPTQSGLRPLLRPWLALLAVIVWAGAAVILLLGWQPGTYLALELVWALPPIGLQLAFGADILWRHRRSLFLAIVPLTTFLSVADAIAINWGIWTINPEKSLNIQVGGILPLEEILFFLLTNILVTFGLTLIWAEVSHVRLLAIKRAVLSTTVFKQRAGTNGRNETIGRSGDLRLR